MEKLYIKDLSKYISSITNDKLDLEINTSIDFIREYLDGCIDNINLMSCDLAKCESMVLQDEIIYECELICLDLPSIHLDLENRLKDAYNSNKAKIYINNIIISKKLSNSEIAKRGCIDSGLLSRILNGKNQPSKDAAIKLCIGMNLDICQSQNLLLRLGYTLSSLNVRDTIIKYGIEKNLDAVNIDFLLISYNEKRLLRD